MHKQINKFYQNTRQSNAQDFICFKKDTHTKNDIQEDVTPKRSPLIPRKRERERQKKLERAKYMLQHHRAIVDTFSVFQALNYEAKS